jgi:hypothetical protein
MTDQRRVRVIAVAAATLILTVAMALLVGPLAAGWPLGIGLLASVAAAQRWPW